jgi:hypothetical protein
MIPNTRCNGGNRGLIATWKYGRAPKMDLSTVSEMSQGHNGGNFLPMSDC